MIVTFEDPALCLVRTSVVDVGWHLYVAHLRADWQLVEVFVFFQGKLPPQRQCIPVRVHLVDQHGIIVLELRSNHERGRMMISLWTLRSDGKDGSVILAYACSRIPPASHCTHDRGQRLPPLLPASAVKHNHLIKTLAYIKLI